VIDANDGYSWTRDGAEAFDRARDACRASAGAGGEGSTAFVRCMDKEAGTASGTDSGAPRTAASVILAMSGGEPFLDPAQPHQRFMGYSYIRFDQSPPPSVSPRLKDTGANRGDDAHERR